MPHLVTTLRINYKISQTELAKRSGISRRLISLIENDPNYNASYNTMVALGAGFGVPASMIFFPQEQLPFRSLITKIQSELEDKYLGKTSETNTPNGDIV